MANTNHSKRLQRAVAESQMLFDAGHVEAAIKTLEEQTDAAPAELNLPMRLQRLKQIATMGTAVVTVGAPVVLAGAEKIRQGYEAAREQVRVLQDQVRRETGQQSGGANLMATLEKLQGNRALARSLRRRLIVDQ